MDWILLIVPGVIWGASFLFIAEGLEAMGPNGVTFTRILVGFLTLALFPGSRRAVSREDWLGTALGRRALDGVPAEHVSLRRAAGLVGAHRDAERRGAALHRDRGRGHGATVAVAEHRRWASRSVWRAAC